MNQSRVLYLLSVALISACGSYTEPDVNCLDDPHTITITNAHTTPRFSWVKDCPARQFEVRYIDSNSTVVRVWQIHATSGTSSLVGPLTYGQLPAGAEGDPAAPLEEGRSYTVRFLGELPSQPLAGYIGDGSFTY